MAAQESFDDKFTSLLNKYVKDTLLRYTIKYYYNSIKENKEYVKSTPITMLFLTLYHYYYGKLNIVKHEIMTLDRKIEMKEIDMYSYLDTSNYHILIPQNLEYTIGGINNISVCNHKVFNGMYTENFLIINDALGDLPVTYENIISYVKLFPKVNQLEYRLLVNLTSERNVLKYIVYNEMIKRFYGLNMDFSEIEKIIDNKVLNKN
jgi:hypothetical protein